MLMLLAHDSYIHMIRDICHFSALPPLFFIELRWWYTCCWYYICRCYCRHLLLPLPCSHVFAIITPPFVIFRPLMFFFSLAAANHAITLLLMPPHCCLPYAAGYILLAIDASYCYYCSFIIATIRLTCSLLLRSFELLPLPIFIIAFSHAAFRH